MSIEDNLPKRIRVINNMNISFHIKIPEEFYPFNSIHTEHLERVKKFIKDNYDIDSFYVGVQDGFIVFRQNY